MGVKVCLHCIGSVASSLFRSSRVGIPNGRIHRRFPLNGGRLAHPRTTDRTLYYASTAGPLVNLLTDPDGPGVEIVPDPLRGLRWSLKAAWLPAQEHFWRRCFVTRVLARSRHRLSRHFGQQSRPETYRRFRPCRRAPRALGARRPPSSRLIEVCGPHSSRSRPANPRPAPSDSLRFGRRLCESAWPPFPC